MILSPSSNLKYSIRSIFSLTLLIPFRVLCYSITLFLSEVKQKIILSHNRFHNCFHLVVNLLPLIQPHYVYPSVYFRYTNSRYLHSIDHLI